MSEFKISDPLLRRIVQAVGVMGVIVFGFYTINLFKSPISVVFDALTPFIAALLMAYILAPAVIALQRQLRMGRIMGTLVLYVVIFLLLTALTAIQLKLSGKEKLL